MRIAWEQPFSKGLFYRFSTALLHSNEKTSYVSSFFAARSAAKLNNRFPPSPDPVIDKILITLQTNIIESPNKVTAICQLSVPTKPTNHGR